MIVRTLGITENQRYSWIKNQRSWFVSRTRPRRLRLKKPQLRFEWRGQDGQNEAEQPDHPASLGDFNAASHSDQVFAAHTHNFCRSNSRKPALF
jgi:hypothetical protein